MRKETIQNKLADLLGLDQFKVDVDKRGKVAVKSSSSTNGPVGVKEEDIDDFRQAQGILYFLQAPALYQAKTCPHCGEGFLVSRQFVKCCSYTCIKKELEKLGIEWSRYNQYDEKFIQEVYDGNEPIWIRGEALESIKKLIGSLEQTQNTSDDSLATV